MVFKDCILEVVLLTVTFLMPPAQTEFDPMLDKSYPYINDYHRNVVHFNCVKMKGCVGNSVKICGYDDLDNELSDFDELCTLYKVNCHYKRGFRQVDGAVCEARKLADVQYPTKNATRGNTNIEGYNNNAELGIETKKFSPSFGYFNWEEEKTLNYQKKIRQKQEEEEQHNQRQEERNVSDNMQENQNKEDKKQDDQNSEREKQKNQITEGEKQDDQEKDKTFKIIRMALMDVAKRLR